MSLSNYPNGEPHKTEVLQADGLLDNNTYYPSANITLYPSSNAVDNGKIFLEKNLRHMVINITDMNYVVMPNPGGYDISFNEETKKIDIEPGVAQINGFEMKTDCQISYRLPTEDELYTGTKYDHKYKGFALLCLHTAFDSLHNLCGNVQVGDTWYCEGIHACYPTTEEYEAHENEYLLLGGVTPDGEVKINDEKYTRINAKYVLVRMEPDPETGLPPEQSTDLLTFINNYLHSYWVSKGGDHEYGNITWRKKPLGYNDPLFKYENEEPLSNDVYAIKVAREGVDSSLDDNPTYQEGYIIIKHSDNQDFKGYEKSLKIVPLGMFYKDNIPDDDNTFNVFVGYVTNDPTHPSYKQVTDDNNTLLTRITNKYKLKTRFGETFLHGTATVESGSIIFDAEGFSQTDNTTPQRFKIQFTPEQMYVGAVDRNTQVQNDLFSIEQSITTMFKDETADDYFRIDMSALSQEISFRTKKQKTYIKLRDDEDIANETDWTNVMNMGDNVEVDHSIWAKGFAVIGTQKNVTNANDVGTDGVLGEDIGTDPSLIEVPDFANTNGYRKLKPGDLVATQVWTAVYNDLAELFVLQDCPSDKKAVIGLLIAQDRDNLDKFTIADKYNTNIIGVVSENPGMCLGNIKQKNTVPVALAGRVNVRYEIGQKLKPGDFVGLSKKTPGHVSKCWHFSKYRCGKVLRVIDNSFVEILVLL